MINLVVRTFMGTAT